MAPKPTFYVPRWTETLPFDDSHRWLGLVVHSYRDPYYDYAPTHLDSTTDKQGVVYEASDYGDVEFRFESSSSPMSRLQRYFQGQSDQDDGTVSASKLKRYQVKNEQKVLQNILTEEKRK